MSTIDKDVKNSVISAVSSDNKPDSNRAQVHADDDDDEKAWRMWKLKVVLVILAGLYIYARLNFRPIDGTDSWSTNSADQADELVTGAESVPQLSSSDL
jgi:hypothetical protein